MLLKTAKSWGLTPKAFREQPLDDQEMMLGYDLFEGTRDAYAQEYRKDWNQKNPGASKASPGQREFGAMQQRKRQPNS